MPYVIAEPCINVKDKACVEVCPVDCIYEGETMLYIHPDECIDCGACEPVCPVKAIFAEDEVPEQWKNFTSQQAVLQRIIGRQTCGETCRDLRVRALGASRGPFVGALRWRHCASRAGHGCWPARDLPPAPCGNREALARGSAWHLGCSAPLAWRQSRRRARSMRVAAAALAITARFRSSSGVSSRPPFIRCAGIARTLLALSGSSARISCASSPISTSPRHRRRLGAASGSSDMGPSNGPPQALGVRRAPAKP